LLKASRDRIAAKLNTSQKGFAAEVIGTFIVVVLGTSSVVIDDKFEGKLGLPFIAFAPFVGIAIGVYLFGKISMAQFNPAVTLALVFGTEVLATALLMAVIYLVVYTKGLRRLGGLAIGGMVGLDIFFLAFISGASMNPARSLAPALLSGVLANLWLYWTATFIGSSAVAFTVRKMFKNDK
jgi:aquaporin Z